MKLTWKGKWREGEVTVDAETVEELDSVLKQLESLGKFGEMPSQSRNAPEIPEIPSMLGCTDAVRMLMQAPWGKQPRLMSEIKEVFQANALYFSKEALAATLVTMTKRGEIRRVREGGKWKYLAK